MPCETRQVTILTMPFFQHLWSYTLHVSCNHHNFRGATTQKSSLVKEHTFLLHCFYQLSGPVEWQLKLEFDSHRNCCPIPTVLQRNSKSVINFLFIYTDNWRLNLTLETQCKTYLTIGGADRLSICQINKCVVAKWG